MASRTRAVTGAARPRSLRTSDLAKEVGIHVNTVRLYESWGLLPPVPRSPSGYRRYTGAHLAQLRLARAVFDGALVGRIKKAAGAMVEQAARGDLSGALERAHAILALAQAERAQAEVAATFLEHWARGGVAETFTRPLEVREAAELLGVSADVLRNWERNGLVRVPHHPKSGYRLYGPAELSRLRVIRMLREAGYSMMAVLRMTRQLDAGRAEGLRHALDTPSPGEDVYSAADHWLSALQSQEKRLHEIIRQLETMI